VDAKALKSVEDEMQKLTDDKRELQNRRMLQALLADRFKLTLRRETQERPSYSLVVVDAKKLREAEGECDPPPPMWQPGMPPLPPPCGSVRLFFGVGHLDGRKVPIPELVRNLSNITKKVVLDKTGLGGNYDINLDWAAEADQFPFLPPTGPAKPDPTKPPLLMAIQQQLGLSLEPQTSPLEILVVDHAERPEEQSKSTATIR
jgi:uncharacterized protein (TIGR03435 family)